MENVSNYPYRCRSFRKKGKRNVEYVIYHPDTLRVVLTPLGGLYHHIELVTVRLCTEEQYEYMGDHPFIAHTKTSKGA